MFWKARLVLLAVPKTGTTALESALLPHADTAILNPPQQKHCTVRRYRNQLQKFFEQRGQRQLELMAVVREPVGWLSSWYRYRARDEISGTENSTAEVTFDDFVDAWLEDTPPEFAKVGRQSRFVSAEDGSLGVDHLFRHDQLDRAVSFLEDRLKTPLELGRSNVSPARPVDLSAAMEARLHTEAPEEFDLWSRVGGDLVP
ncbi:sulfotransferase family 2 domain-containing protein [Gymnodinialimonas ceratoperidinii]|uniref:sulfotransferase family 2 domain-containing protein n=1 Tax=Gymnodinialimonas ceratoperidinii TaxID=2856823 RepID=UPI001FFCD60E|nr:sulfotransferase family 2 domain-containing protein [Gymnodinialimonas ceratoperidinii]